MLGAFLALAVTYVLPEKFEAATTVLIRPRRGNASDQTAKSMMDYPVSFNIPVDAMSKTYAQVMGSDAVVTRVVDRLHLDTLQPPRDPRWWKRAYQEARDVAKLAVVRTWEFLRYGRIEPVDPYRDAVETVKKNLDAAPVTDTFLFSLKASNTDPELAALIANTAAEVFIEYTRQARMDEEGTGARDIRLRLDKVRAQLDDARTRLQAFGDGTAASSLDRELQLSLDELSKFQAARAGVAQHLNGLRAETDALRGQMAAERESVQISSTVARNPVVTEIETALARAQVEYAGLFKTLQPDHPRMLELQAQITEAERRLAAATAQVPDRDTSALNQTREQINQKLLDRVAQREAAAAQVRAMDQTIAEYQQRVESLTTQKSELSTLNLELDVREAEYRLLSQEEAQANLAAMQQLGEIRQLHTAVPPVYPVRPIKIYYVAAGFMLGMILSLLMVLLVDYADPRVHDVESASSDLRVPVVAVVPHSLTTGAVDAMTVDLSLRRSPPRLSDGGPS
jgi:succinoglycan biosynthesis transport protein ExoP